MNESDIRLLIQEHIAECDVEYRSFALWGDRLKRYNLFTVVLPVVLSTIAGAAIFKDQPEFFPLGKIGIGICTLVSGLLMALHKGLNCDACQAECRRLEQAYRGLRTRYVNLSIVDFDELKQKVEEINERFVLVQESAHQIKVPEKYRKMAQQERQGRKV